MAILSQSYAKRAENFKHPLAKQLLLLMHEKKTNLSLSADVTQKQQLLDLADQVGPEICMLKTHIDIIEDFDQQLISDLKELARRHQFLLFEDRKFADIGNTVQHQYQNGIYHIADWADIVNAHSVPGPSVIQGLKAVGLAKQRACLLIAELSCKDHLMDTDYMNATLKMAIDHQDFVIGFIAQHRLAATPDFIYFTPGVNLETKGDALGQNYSHPEYVIKNCGSDVIIVGRGIYQHPSPKIAAQQYRKLGWDAYQQRGQNHHR